MIYIPRKVIQSIDYIFVDFFDTLMFRRVHSSQMWGQWDRTLSDKLGISYGLLSSSRKKIISGTGKDECAISYCELCDLLWQELYNRVNASDFISKNEFYELSREVETYLELGVQYINREIYSFLKRQKKVGKKIVLVTDFYLPTESYKVFGRRYQLENLIDYWFCSSDLGVTKSGEGKIYEYVIQKLGVDPSHILMIGDNKKSDKMNAEKFGMQAYRYFPFFHKIRTNLVRKVGFRGAKLCYKNVIKSAEKDVAFGEYTFPIAYFTKKLYVELQGNGENAHFLSRGGFFLKKMMDAYQHICIPDRKKLKTAYVLNSRKVNKLAETDAQAKRLLKDYLLQYVDNETFSFVDEGWNGSGQLIFTRTLGLKTNGYYLGLMKNFQEQNCKRQGILFGMNEKGVKSPYYGVFRTNCTFYEQILTAPHGSVQKYYCDEEGDIKVEVAENQKEKMLYEHNTKKLQIFLLDYAKALFAWQCEFSEYLIAKRMMRSLLFANKKKRNLLKFYDDNYFDNAVDSSQKSFGHIKQMKINVLKLICCPEKYLRYFCKVKEKCNLSIFYAIYIPFGFLIFCYCRLSLFVKHLSMGEKHYEKV